MQQLRWGITSGDEDRDTIGIGRTMNGISTIISHSMVNWQHGKLSKYVLLHLTSFVTNVLRFTRLLHYIFLLVKSSPNVSEHL